MYPDPWQTLPGFTAHDWMRHSGQTTLTQVACSMVESCHIKDGDAIIGSSLGGMVACEISKIRKIPRIYLIGSAVHKGEVSTLLSALHPLAKLAPFDLLRFSASKFPAELAQMVSEMETSFIRAMCEAVFQWEGLGASSTLAIRLHGKFDLIIPPPKIPDLLLNGGHLISITHAQKCVDFIRSKEAE